MGTQLWWKKCGTGVGGKMPAVQLWSWALVNVFHMKDLFIFLASQDALEVMSVTESLTH